MDSFARNKGGIRLSRRDALRALGGVALLPALPALAQSPSSQRRQPLRVGVLYWGPESYSSTYFAPHFLKALAELGHSVGSSLEIEWRYSDGDTERDARLAAQLRNARLDAIVTAGSERTAIVTRALPALPIVTHLHDPVAGGFAKTLSRPGGQVTGLTVELELTAGKQFELLRRLMPKLAHVSVLIDAVTQNPEPRAAPVIQAARRAGLTADWKVVGGLEGFENAFALLRPDAPRAAFIQNTRPSTDVAKLAVLAVKHRVATMSLYRVSVEQGGLMAYFVNNAEVGRRLAGLLDKLLRGAQPGTIPFEQPTRFDFVINRATARAIGLEIPREILLEADQVIG